MKKSAVILVLVLTAVMFFAGCGSSQQGVYKSKFGNTTSVLTLKAGNSAVFSLDGSVGIPVTYKVKDGSVVLIGADGTEITMGRFAIEGAGLRDPGGNLHKKQ